MTRLSACPFRKRPLVLALLPLWCLQAHAQTQGNIETIVVQGQKLQQTLQAEQALTPGGVSVIDSTQLFERSVVTMQDALRFVPGVWAISTSGTDGTFLSSRGSNLDATNYDMNGIKLLQDGLPVTTADGNNHNRMIDPLATRFASIARGANALTYGASTLGGAMNFTTPTARDSAPTQISVNSGSFGLQNVRATLGRQLGERLDVQVTADEQRREGYRDHNDSARSNLYGNLGLRLSDNVDTRFFVTVSNYDEELPGALTAAQLEADPRMSPDDAWSGDYQYDVLAKRVANKTTIRLSDDSSLEVGVSRETQDLFHPIVDVRVDFDGPGPMGLTQVFSLLIDTTQTNSGAMLRYNRIVGDHDLLVGANWGSSDVRGEHYSHNRAVRTRMDARIDNHAESVEFFAMDRWSLSQQLTLVYGLQAVDTQRDVRTLSLPSNQLRNPAGDYDSLNPRAGLIYALNDTVSVFGNVSRLYEAPTNYELEDDLRGNNTLLEAMTGKVLEVGSRGSRALSAGNTVYWDAAVYYATLQDEILSQDDPRAPGTSLSINAGDTIHAGVEAMFGGEFQWGSGRLEPVLSLTLNEFSFDGDRLYGNGSLPAAPDYAVRGEVMYHMPGGFHAGPTFERTGSRQLDFVNSASVDAYSLLGFRAGVTRDSWSAYVEVKNLSDEDYVSSFTVRDRYTAGSPVFQSGEPRAFFAGVRMAF